MSTLAQMISSAFPGGPRCLCSPEDVPVAALGRRRKLWELPHAYHCALIGTCLPVPDMRRLAPHSGYDVSKMTDYSLHTVVVGYCEERSALTEAIQRFLDKRHAQAIARFTPAKSAAEIAYAWRETLAAGEDVPGALWAAWTHSCTDDDLGREIHGDIHMLSHQVGTALRADLRQLEQHRREAQTLRQEFEALHRKLDDERRTHAAELATLSRELELSRQRAAQVAALERELGAAARERKEHAALQQRATMLAARAEALEEWNGTNARHAAQLEIELKAARAALATVATTEVDAPVCGRACPPDTGAGGALRALHRRPHRDGRWLSQAGRAPHGGRFAAPRRRPARKPASHRCRDGRRRCRGLPGRLRFPRRLLAHEGGLQEARQALRLRPVARRRQLRPRPRRPRAAKRRQATRSPCSSAEP
jgi:hypothetical protein